MPRDYGVVPNLGGFVPFLLDQAESGRLDPETLSSLAQTATALARLQPSPTPPPAPRPNGFFPEDTGQTGGGLLQPLLGPIPSILAGTQTFEEYLRAREANRAGFATNQSLTNLGRARVGAGGVGAGARAAGGSGAGDEAVRQGEETGDRNIPATAETQRGIDRLVNEAGYSREEATALVGNFRGTADFGLFIETLIQARVSPPDQEAPRGAQPSTGPQNDPRASSAIPGRQGSPNAPRFFDPTEPPEGAEFDGVPATEVDPRTGRVRGLPEGFVPADAILDPVTGEELDPDNPIDAAAIARFEEIARQRAEINGVETVSDADAAFADELLRQAQLLLGNTPLPPVSSGPSSPFAAEAARAGAITGDNGQQAGAIGRINDAFGTIPGRFSAEPATFERIAIEAANANRQTLRTEIETDRAAALAALDEEEAEVSATLQTARRQAVDDAVANSNPVDSPERSLGPSNVVHTDVAFAQWSELAGNFEIAANPEEARIITGLFAYMAISQTQGQEFNADVIRAVIQAAAEDPEVDIRSDDVDRLWRQALLWFGRERGGAALAFGFDTQYLDEDQIAALQLEMQEFLTYAAERGWLTAEQAQELG